MYRIACFSFASANTRSIFSFLRSYIFLYIGVCLMVCWHKFFYAEYFYLFAVFSLFYYYFHHRFYFNISIKAQLLLDFFDSLSRHESVCFFWHNKISSASKEVGLVLGMRAESCRMARTFLRRKHFTSETRPLYLLVMASFNEKTKSTCFCKCFFWSRRVIRK